MLFGGNVYAADTSEAEVILPLEIEGLEHEDEAFRLLKQINQKREKITVAALTMDYKLCEAAKERAAEQTLSYGQTRPDDTDYKTVMTGLYSSWIKEICMEGPTSATAAMKVLEDSYSNKTAMINSEYVSAGIACFQHAGRYYWLILFSDQSFGTQEEKKNETKSFTLQGKKGNLVARYETSVSNGAVTVGESIEGQFYIRNIRNINCKAFPKISTLTFSSSDTSVAMVDSNGKITGVSTGSAIITARLKIEPSIGSSFVVNVAQKKTGLEKASVLISPAALYYTGKEKRPQVIISYGAVELKEGTDFTVNYRKNVEAGQAQVNLIGYGSYSGTRQEHFEIKKLPLEKADITLDRTYYYCTGKEVQPKVTVSFAEVSFVEGRDYTVEYSNNIEAGAGQLTVTGIGSCEGVVEKRYEIRKKAWPISLEKKIVITDSGFLYQPEWKLEEDVELPTEGSIQFQCDKKGVAVGTSHNAMAINGAGYTKVKVIIPESAYYEKTTLETLLIVRPQKTKELRGSTSKNQKLTLSWKHVRGAEGYLIQYSKNKNFKKQHLYVVDDKNSTGVTLKTLEKGKRWYVRVRAYIIYNKDRYYGEYSDSIRTKTGR